MIMIQLLKFKISFSKFQKFQNLIATKFSKQLNKFILGLKPKKLKTCMYTLIPCILAQGQNFIFKIWPGFKIKKIFIFSWFWS